ncbi:Intradiol ring-cleavage dioxygenase [Mycena rosella]|uniref:Intradiol ring-cleavage dioxygenase n=1 Tax=Mycena rosella TaxID=1033263 RepID=A0AAD7CV78_MYCRO|nr:Intradiol ring-cleavage dioxygenase [Mycena rosella]
MFDYTDKAALTANKLTADHGIDLSKLPKIDMSTASITEIVHAMNSNCPDERMKFVFKNLVDHLHDFVRETSITTEEWMSALEFLTQTGQGNPSVFDLQPVAQSDSNYPEFKRLSDVLGVSSLVGSMNDAKPPGATEVSDLGPFFADDALEFDNGASIASEGKGDYMWVEGKVLDTKGNPISNCLLHAWEADGHGMYDVQYSPGGSDCRGRLRTTDDGSFCFRAVVPVPYLIPVPSDNPVGQLIVSLGRHTFRPAHLHMMLEAPGFETLVTALYFKGDPFLTSDVVCGVKTSLIVDTTTETDLAVTRARGFVEAKSHQVLKHNFVLATPEECAEARKRSIQ